MGHRQLIHCVAAIAGVLISATSAADLPAPVKAGSSEPVVYMIGMQHAPGQFYAESLSPGHVRAALDVIDPDLVGVESDPRWFAQGHFYRFTYEAFAVAVPWVRARSRPAVGIDWVGDSSTHWDERLRLARVEHEAKTLGAQTVDPAYYGYGTSRQDQRRLANARNVATFAHLNGPEFAAERMAWLDAEKDKPGTAQAYIAVRDRHIAEHIAAAAKTQGVKRMAVVIGAAHLGNVPRELARLGVKVGDLCELLAAAEAPTESSADDRLSARDIAAILVESLDGDAGIATDPARESRLFERLAEQAANTKSGTSDWMEHVRARRALLGGDLAQAETAWRALADSGRSTAFPYVGASWRHRLTVQQLALLELGRMADLRGDRSQAIAAYQRLLNAIPEPEFSRDEHSDFELLARARNAVRGLLGQPYKHEMAFAIRQAPGPVNAVTAAPPRAELKAAWEHHRARQWPELAKAVEELTNAPDLSAIESIELKYLATAASLETGQKDKASFAIVELEKEITGLAEHHWLRRELPALRSRLDQAKAPVSH